jgi:hypothetical protein
VNANGSDVPIRTLASQAEAPHPISPTRHPVLYDGAQPARSRVDRLRSIVSVESRLLLFVSRGDTPLVQLSGLNMNNAIHAVHRFQSFTDYVKEDKPTPLSNPRIEKAVFMPIEASSHVVISQEGNRRLAAEQAGKHWDWDI